MRIFFILTAFYLSLFASIGSVSMLKGKATITRDGNILNAQVGSTIEEGDRVNTFVKSRVQIILNDDTITTLGKNTEYIFNSYSNDSNPHAYMTLRRGFLRTVTGKIGKIAPERFKVKTKTSSIGIRGTGWITYVGENVEHSLCFEGAIIITTKDGTYNVSAGNMLLMKNGVFKKYKADMNYFNAEIKQAQIKAKTKSSNQQPSLDSYEEIVPFEPNNQQSLNLDEDVMLFEPNKNLQKSKKLLVKNESMSISVVGQGVAPSFTSSPAQAYAMAKRAAIADAYRLLAEQIHGIRIEGQDTIKNMMIKRSTIRSRIKGMINNADIVETTYKDGLCEVEMETRIHYSQFN